MYALFARLMNTRPQLRKVQGLAVSSLRGFDDTLLHVVAMEGRGPTMRAHEPDHSHELPIGAASLCTIK